MFGKKEYANGHKVNDLNTNKLFYFFRNGKVKAEGLFENNLIGGKWRFYLETGLRWQIGNFGDGKKNGFLLDRT
ncbi:MAG: hypothetical protein HOO86_08595 [Bacteroidales bacterium]|nr:hypothetical protein [Bacteroidales bacterium]